MVLSTHISVVVPAYNEERMIGQCLRALRHQTRQPDVVYVVDNNSTDATTEIATSFENVIVIREDVQGICAATYTGLNAAAVHGGILLRCDADCRPEQTWIEDIEQAFRSNEAISVVTGPGVAYDVGVYRRTLIRWLYMNPYFSLVGLAIGRPPLFGSNFGIRAQQWRQIEQHTHLKDRQDIHDDIDISYHITGDILYVKDLQMPISARPFRSLPSMVQRYIRGFRSLFIHWPAQAPWNMRRR